MPPPTEDKMAYTVADMDSNFRTDTGENTQNPTAADVVKYFNRVTRGPRSCLLPLFPALGSDDFGVNVITKDITADGNTHEHTVTLTTPMAKLGMVGLLFSGADEYVWVEPSQIRRSPISENDELAYGASYDEPVVSYCNGKLYTYPEPVGIRMIYLGDPAAIAVGGASFSISDRLVDLALIYAECAYYTGRKMYDQAKYYQDLGDRTTSQLLRNAPGRQGPVKFLPGPGNLTSRM